MEEYYFSQKVQCVIVIKSKFLKVASGFLSNLTGTKVPILSNISTLNTFFSIKSMQGDKFMPEIHLKPPGIIKVFAAHSMKIKKEHKNLKK